MYHMFKRFDMDGDGYVSHQDFDDFVKSIKVTATKKEVASVLKLLDTNNQGYLTFTDFSKVFSPSMS
jgi:Ca2+-binding EF-hand superfamily protein